MKIPNTLEELKSYATIEQKAGETSVQGPAYTPEELLYLGSLRTRLISARTQRDSNHEQFDGQTYVERCAQNRRIAQTMIKPRTNRAEIEFSTGTPRAKLIEQLAHLANLSLSSDITAFDEDDFAIAEMGEGIENILEKQDELDNGEEKRLRRFYTLFEQGEVFVEREWKEDWINDKQLQGKFDGKFRGVNWMQRMKKGVGGLRTNIIRNEHVYLGNITLFDMEDQPYIFARKVVHYTDLAPLFKSFEMWQYVEMCFKSWDSAFAQTGTQSFNPFWHLEAVKKGFCEVIIYQSNAAHDNELQVLIDGIPMFPPGFPLPWKHGQYSIVKQIAEIIDEHFAYGKSLIQRLKMAGALEDEMWRNIFTLYQQMIKPPMVNNTGTVLSSKMFLPGTITNGIPMDKLKPLLESSRTGMKGESQVLSMIRQNLNEHSNTPQFSGQSPSGDPTATEVATVQQQAEKIFGLSVLVSSFLEQKLDRIGVDLILEKYFDPVDMKVDKVRNALKNVYRRSNVQKPIEGRGMGQEVVMVAEGQEVPSPYQVFDAEKKLEETTGMPTRIIVLNRDEIVASKYTWRIKTIPRPRRSTNLQKLMFREEVDMFMISPNFNFDWFEEKAAVTYGENPSKVFKRQEGMVPTTAAGIAPPQDPRLSPAKMTPQTRKPTVNAMAQA